MEKGQQEVVVWLPFNRKTFAPAWRDGDDDAVVIISFFVLHPTFLMMICVRMFENYAVLWKSMLGGKLEGKYLCLKLITWQKDK